MVVCQRSDKFRQLEPGRRARLLAGIVAVLAAVAVAVFPSAVSPASAHPGRTPDLPPAAHHAAVTDQGVRSAQAQRELARYWTPQRMRSAIPAGIEFTLRRLGSANSDASAGEAVRVSPQPRIGRVFFTVGGRNYTCSGTVTSSSNGDVVTTAGHCLHSGRGYFATNFVFVPGYRNGEAPYGTWTARQLFVHHRFAESASANYDVGFAVMNELDGRSIVQAVGAYPIAFNMPRGLTYTSYGYPSEAPYDGRALWSCHGRVVDDPRGTNDQGLACSMTDGSSGGGWITSRGWLNSVNSFTYTGESETMWGPYFGSAIRDVYYAAAQA